MEGTTAGKPTKIKKKKKIKESYLKRWETDKSEKIWKGFCWKI